MKSTKVIAEPRTSRFSNLHRSLKKQQYTSGISSRPPAYEIGEKVKLIYSPQQIDDVKTISFWGLYRWSVILLMDASPLLVIGGAYLLYISK